MFTYMSYVAMVTMTFQYNGYFKPKISALLKRHCCYSNGCCNSFSRKNTTSSVVIFLIVLSLSFNI